MLDKKVITAIRILSQIEENETMTVAEIADFFSMSTSRVEQYMAKLRRYRYVVGRRGLGGGYRLWDGLDVSRLPVFGIGVTVGAYDASFATYKAQASKFTVGDIIDLAILNK